jgi:peptidoglycan/xylan/chitin deacetylase (PgdA/CDA1 family)
MNIARTPFVIKKLFPEIIWSFPNERGKLFLSFDDGPHPDVTPFVIDQLKKYNAKATFFCLGKQVEKYPDIYQLIISEGHAVGNHTFSHFKPLRMSCKEYVYDILKAAELINSALFRPPYGKMTWKQYKAIKKDYKIVLWDIISYDFDKNTSAEKCIDNVIKNSQDGSIVVFHDALHAFKNLRFALPSVLEFFSTKNIEFDKVN